MTTLGVSNEISKAVVNHSVRNAVDRIYYRYDFVMEKRRALERWAEHVMRVNGRSGAMASDPFRFAR